MKKELILGGISILMLFFMVLPGVSACIDIKGIGTQYDGIDHYGYVDYQNVANVNASGVILVFIDGDIVAAKILDMPIRYIAGFRCSPMKTLEFHLNDAEGNHSIHAYTFSQNVSAQRSYDYYAEDWWMEEEDEVEEVVEEWMECP